MAEITDWNSKIIAQFRANDGKVGPPFEGTPLALLHHRGRKSGREYVNPVMYMAREDDPAVIYVFASKAGRPENPGWYYNLRDAGSGEAEVGAETYPVTVTELSGAERARVYAEQARRYPVFAEYAEKTAGVRDIPVLALRRT